jgi:hypothetical protein
MSSKPNGCKCSLCHEWQYWTPSGMTCKNGHGGAPGINTPLTPSQPESPKARTVEVQMKTKGGSWHKVDGGIERAEQLTHENPGVYQVRELVVGPSELNPDTLMLNWLDKNIFHREKGRLDAELRSGYNMWVMFAPAGHQGSARNIIAAAMKAEQS